MRLGYTLLGFILIILGVALYLITGMTIWIWYPYIAIPNPFAVFKPLTYLVIGLGVLATAFGLFSRGGQK